MKYNIETWTIKRLVEYYNKNIINLNPPYQRNDIWSLPAKKRLIDTILKGYPLPTFFFHKKENGHYDCVDGQQRIRTIIGYSNDLFTNLEGHKFSESEKKHSVEEYQIPIIVIEDVDPNQDQSMEDFYYRVNMFGSKLNRPEILKSKYFNNPLQNLIERLTDSEEFIHLNLFTDSTLNRMIDYDFVGELIALLKDGITEKKKAVDKLYEDETFNESAAKQYEKVFYNLLSIFIALNKAYPIKETRYKQKNDFYSLFHFYKKMRDYSIETLVYIYKLLVFFDNDIVPSNEKCYAFQEYAFNCISQSNSKNAREVRNSILEDIFLNKDNQPLAKKHDKEETNMNLIDVLEFYKLSDSDLVNIEGLYLIDIIKMGNLKPEINFYK